MPNIQAQTLLDFIDQTFQAAGAPPDHAELVARTLVAANLAGHDSHGVIRTVQYLAGIQNGTLDPVATPTVVQESGVVTHLDGHRGFGQVVAREAMRIAIRKAKEQSLAATGFMRAGHVGRLGEWVAMAASENMIGLAFCNAGSRGGLVAPYGGAARRMGTNPFAAAIPQEGNPPMLVDFATSVWAEGKVRVARNQGKPVPPGRIIDVNGVPSTNPNDLYDGGMLLPMGEYKGYGLSLLMDFLGGLVTGHGCSGMPEYEQYGNGAIFMALSIDAFRPLNDFFGASERYTELIRSTPPAPGTEEVLLPGDPEWRTTEQRSRDGIPLDETTWGQLAAAAAEWGVDAPTVE